jgi:hypothetical protein
LMQVSGAPVLVRWGKRLQPVSPATMRLMEGLSLWSEDSFLSLGCTGSFLSVGSIGSALSIGSVGSVGSAFSVGSAGSLGSVLSAGAKASVLSVGTDGAVFGEAEQRLPAVVLTGALLAITAGLLVWRAKAARA